MSSVETRNINSGYGDESDERTQRRHDFDLFSHWVLGMVTIKVEDHFEPQESFSTTFRCGAV